MADFATVQDVIDLFRSLTPAEKTRTESLLPLVCDALRNEANKVGKDLDEMAASDTFYANTLKLVTVDVISRVLRQDVEAEPMSQMSQSALGYSISGTYAIPGGGIAQSIMNNDLKRLGLRRQQIGTLNLGGGGLA